MHVKVMDLLMIFISFSTQIPNISHEIIVFLLILLFNLILICIKLLTLKILMSNSILLSMNKNLHTKANHQTHGSDKQGD